MKPLWIQVEADSPASLGQLFNHLNEAGWTLASSEDPASDYLRVHPGRSDAMLVGRDGRDGDQLSWIRGQSVWCDHKKPTHYWPEDRAEILEYCGLVAKPTTGTMEVIPL